MSIWILCSYEDNGYITSTYHPSKKEALNHAPWDNPDWCVVSYNVLTDKYYTVYAEGKPFPVNILRSKRDENISLTIYSDPVDKLSKPELHYEETGPISDPTINRMT